ncbi:hypothetical protein I4O60_06390 [Clostridioides difficile]|nr:hypothetical protein [Clostridioides difficile]
MKYLVSIDGGGTKTKFCVSDLDGNILKEHTTGSTNYKSVGIKKTYENINNGFKKILKDLYIDYDDIEYTVFGISGCDSPNDYKIIMDEILKIGINKEKIYLANDAVLAFYAQADSPGLVIVAGTGSIILGIKEDGEINIVLSGGTLNKTVYAQMLMNNLKTENTDKNLKFISQENQPVYGGIRLAMALANRRVNHG